MKQIEREIFDEMVKAIELLGAESDLLSIAGSFQDSLSDEMVLRALREWNAIYAQADSKFSPSVCR